MNKHLKLAHQLHQLIKTIIYQDTKHIVLTHTEDHNYSEKPNTDTYLLTNTRKDWINYTKKHLQENNNYPLIRIRYLQQHIEIGTLPNFQSWLTHLANDQTKSTTIPYADKDLIEKTAQITINWTIEQYISQATESPENAPHKNPAHGSRGRPKAQEKQRKKQETYATRKNRKGKRQPPTPKPRKINRRTGIPKQRRGK